MNELADFFPQLPLLAALPIASLAAAPLTKRLGLPGPAALLAVGITAGLFGIAPTEWLSTITPEQIGSVALYAILFQGGLGTGFRAWRRSAQPILGAMEPISR
jgi:NhaP-type Na+/H+ and K+/H+ antiporter